MVATVSLFDIAAGVTQQALAIAEVPAARALAQLAAQGALRLQLQAGDRLDRLSHGRILVRDRMVEKLLKRHHGTNASALGVGIDRAERVDLLEADHAIWRDDHF